MNALLKVDFRSSPARVLGHTYVPAKTDGALALSGNRFAYTTHDQDPWVTAAASMSGPTRGLFYVADSGICEQARVWRGAALKDRRHSVLVGGLQQRFDPTLVSLRGARVGSVPGTVG